MANGPLSPVIRHLRRLSRPAARDGISDAQLLERFLVQGDQAAFELLLWRHGPMVWGLCRRILHDHHEAEDAFQATMLVLARKAGSIGQSHSIASWLYKVAYRIALRARAASSRRARFEKHVRQLTTAAVCPDLESTWGELRRVIDEELARLPEKYRAPVVLCYLQNKTNEEAAKLLRWPIGTVKTRLVRARELLGQRLGRRGVALSAAGLATVLAPPVAEAALPAGILNATLGAAMLLPSAKVGAIGLVSSRGVLLMEGALKAMFMTKLKIAMGVLLAVGTAGAGVGLISYQSLAASQAGDNNKSQSVQNSLKGKAPPGDRKAEGKHPSTQTDLEVAEIDVRKAEADLQVAKAKLEIARKKLQEVKKEFRIETVPGTQYQRYTDVLIVPLGGSLEMRMKRNKTIKKVEYNERFLDIQKTPEPEMITLVGKEVGTSRLELTAQDNAKESYQVFVELAAPEIQGKWKVTKVHINGKHLPQEMSEKQTWTIEGDTIAIQYEDGSSEKLTFRLDPTKKPAEIDLNYSDRPYKETTFHGIYETWNQPLVEGGFLEICFTADERPKHFDEHPGRRLVVLHREAKSKEPVAYIFNLPVTREELADYLIAHYGADKLEQLVNKLVIERACREKGIVVRPEEVEAALQADLNSMNITRSEFETNVLTKYHKTLFEWREDVILPRLCLEKLARTRVTVTEEDIRQAFEADCGEKVECQIILWPKGQAERGILLSPDLVKNSEEFDRLAKQQMTSTLAAQAGRISAIGRHTTDNEAFEKAVFELKPGEITLLETTEGTLAIKCLRRLPPDPSKKLEDMRDALTKAVMAKKVQQEIPRLFKELREQAQPKLLLKK
jgi:RNA polymerase sigma factor (sigma-70 family)